MIKYFSSISLQKSLMLLWLLPLIFVSLTLGIYIINQRIIDINDALDDKQLTILRYMAESSDYAMYANNNDVLIKIANSLETGTDITGAIFYDKETGMVITSKNINPNNFFLDKIINNYPPESKLLINEQRLIYKEIISETIDIESDYFYSTNSSSSKPEILGYAFIIISDDYVKTKQNDIMLTGVIICITGLLIAVLFAYYFSNKISNIFSTVSDSIKELEIGNYKLVIPENYEGETGKLYTGIRNLAKQLHNHNAEMSYNISIATNKLQKSIKKIKLQNDELVFAREKAELANKSKNHFLAKMSHDLSTPINAITGFANLIKQRSTNENDIEESEIIITSSNILLSIVDDLLDYSKIELAEIELHYSPFNITQFAKNVYQMNIDNAQSRNLDFVLHISPEENVIVYGDEYKLSQILNNLVSNSIKYTPSGTVEIFINSKKNNYNTYTIEFTIRDTGIGIPKDKLSCIFDPFVQLNREFSVNNSSTGLGLSIVKKLVDLMKGNIEINSTENVGTTVNIQIQFTTDKKNKKDEAVNTSP